MPSTFTADAIARLPGPGWLSAYRTAAFERFQSGPLPDPAEEVWRYFPVDELDLDAYRPVAEAPHPSNGEARLAAGRGGVSLAPLTDGASVVETRNGWLVGDPSGERPTRSLARPLQDGLVVGPLTARTDGDEVLDRVLDGDDAFVRLNQACSPGAILVDVPAGVTLDAPVVVVHVVEPSGRRTGDHGFPAVFPRLTVRLGDGARAALVEVAIGGDHALVVPLTELSVGDGGSLSYVSLQLLGNQAWSLARTAGRVGRDGSLVMFTAGMGGSRNRLRTDVVAGGQGAATTLCSTFLGTGDQVHDVRTLQDHAAPRSTSDLLCQGAVADDSRSVYTGLIRVRRGATRSDAMQRNRNLVLGDRAHADSVPNLDIEENDVRCSHASTVGPIDPDQRYYVESRGVPPAEAEAVIVRGFYRDVLARCPVPGAGAVLGVDVDRRIQGALDRAAASA